MATIAVVIIRLRRPQDGESTYHASRCPLGSTIVAREHVITIDSNSDPDGQLFPAWCIQWWRGHTGLTTIIPARRGPWCGT
jgi:hypothetical protein